MKRAREEPRKKVNFYLTVKKIRAHAYAEHTYGPVIENKTFNLGVF